MRQFIAISLVAGSAVLFLGCPSDPAHRVDGHHRHHRPAVHHGPNTDVARCMRDNADARVHRDVVRRYCACMDDKMSKHDRRSISEWERSHPRAMAECERVAGWW
ncbi:MAG: hypothetical protein H7838_07470 [Magnetococcus sp. DMHC-8]